MYLISIISSIPGSQGKDGKIGKFLDILGDDASQINAAECRALLFPLGAKINRQGHFVMPQAYKKVHLLHPKINEIGHERASHDFPRADIQ